MAVNLAKFFHVQLAEDDLQRAGLPTARPTDYYRKFLEQDIRPDGRSLEEFRPTLVNLKCVSTAEGSAIVKVGNTTVMCGIKAEIATPKAEEPKKGYLVPNIELSPLCSPMFKPGPPSEQAQDLSQFVADVIKHSGCIDTEELCIVPGKYVWVLYCDMICLDYDGNVGDASVLALLAALKNTTLPKVSFDEEEERLIVNTEERCHVTIHSNPVSSTFVVFDNEILLVDPTVEEESLSTGELTVVTTEDQLCVVRKPVEEESLSTGELTVVTTEDQLCVVRKPGGSTLSTDKLSMCLDQAFHRNRQVIQLIRETIESIDR